MGRAKVRGKFRACGPEQPANFRYGWELSRNPGMAKRKRTPNVVRKVNPRPARQRKTDDPLQELRQMFAKEYNARKQRDWDADRIGQSPVNTKAKRTRRPKELVAKIKKIREAKKKNIAKRRALMDYYRVLVAELATLQPPKRKVRGGPMQLDAPATISPARIFASNEPGWGDQLD